MNPAIYFSSMDRMQTSDDHRRVRETLVSFLKPETLRGALIGKMDKEVAKLLEMHWQGNRKIAIFNKLFGNAFNEEPHIQHNELTNIWNGARSN
ncbi:hypothetical protein WN943_012231 [Citrus x changshan-huyou]